MKEQRVNEEIYRTKTENLPPSRDRLRPSAGLHLRRLTAVSEVWMADAFWLENRTRGRTTPRDDDCSFPELAEDDDCQDNQ